MTSDKAWDDMGKLLNKFYQMPDAGTYCIEYTMSTWVYS